MAAAAAAAADLTMFSAFYPVKGKEKYQVLQFRLEKIAYI